MRSHPMESNHQCSMRFFLVIRVTSPRLGVAEESRKKKCDKNCENKRPSTADEVGGGGT
jgi:hypothetical protein